MKFQEIPVGGERTRRSSPAVPFGGLSLSSLWILFGGLVSPGRRVYKVNVFEPETRERE